MFRKINIFIVNLAILFLLSFVLTARCYSQLQDWRYEVPVTITNNSGLWLSNYPLLMRINTAMYINAGFMQPDGRDIRFASTCGSGLINYLLENYINTDSTRIWVNIASLAPYTSSIIFMFMGNPSATSASNLSLFEGPYSSTNNVMLQLTNTVSYSQRGFRFSSDKDIIITHFGKRVPNSTPRYVTLFDFNSQQIVAQTQVPGGSQGVYNYSSLSRPVWLLAGQKYVLEVYQGEGDDYYFGVSTQVGPYLTYYDMRYANNCSQNTFPTSVVPGYNYGTPDLVYYVRQTPVNPEPSAFTGPAADTNTPAEPTNLTAIAGNQQALLKWNKNSEFDMDKYFIFMSNTDNSGVAEQIGFTNQPDTTFPVSGLANGIPYYFWVKAADKYCSMRVSGFSNAAMIMPLSVHGLLQAPKEFALYQNYPNPFNPVTQIKYDIPNGSFVKLVVYDMLGREVSVLVNETKRPGSYTATWGSGNYPSGIYIYKLTAGNYEHVMKMVLLK
jgi:hypothetical protein